MRGKQMFSDEALTERSLYHGSSPNSGKLRTPCRVGLSSAWSVSLRPSVTLDAPDASIAQVLVSD